jgi:hypothetical protein
LANGNAPTGGTQPAGEFTNAFLVSDRTVYRPGDTARFRLWVRTGRDDKFRPAPAQKMHFVVSDPNYGRSEHGRFELDAAGNGTFEVPLERTAALGEYTLSVAPGEPPAPPAEEGVGGGMAGPGTGIFGGGLEGGIAFVRFRVEEYKKPEFEVTVDSAASRVKLGERGTVRIRARYYYGGPVAGGSARVRVWRNAFVVNNPVENDEWSWFYEGLPFGRCYSPPGELLIDRELVLDEQGVADFVLDTGPDFADDPDADRQYVVEAEVRDGNRRTVTGSGTLTASRAEFAIDVRSDRGWYRPKKQKKQGLPPGRRMGSLFPCGGEVDP